MAFNKELMEMGHKTDKLENLMKQSHFQVQQ